MYVAANVNCTGTEPVGRVEILDWGMILGAWSRKRVVGTHRCKVKLILESEDWPNRKLVLDFDRLCEINITDATMKPTERQEETRESIDVVRLEKD